MPPPAIRISVEAKTVDRITALDIDDDGRSLSMTAGDARLAIRGTVNELSELVDRLAAAVVGLDATG